MKKNNRAGKLMLSLGILAISLNSCSKYTELTPLSSLSESTAFTSVGNIELVANGMYQAAAVGTYEGGAGRGYPFGAASIEQGEMRGEDMINLQAFYQFTYEATYSPSTANNKNHWEQLYALINQANVLITGVEGAIQNGVISQEDGNAYIAEGKFIRALSHHELLIHFSRPYADGNGSSMGVPYRTIAITNTDAMAEGATVDRGTVAQTYAKIIEDLDWAEQNLPATRTEQISRATAGAAIALKTRVKLHMQDFTGVVLEANKLGASIPTGSFISPVGGYKLEADPTQPFTSYKANSESIFSIANSATSNGGVNGALANMFGPSSKNARDLIATSPNLYNASFWLKDDLRRNLQFRQSSGNYKLVFNTKYTDYGVFGDWAPIIRYAEVLLNAAEAYARQGNNTQALLLLNAVRDRSVPDGASYGTNQPSDLILTILNERRIEFTGEGRRWSDLHRLALDPVYGTGGIPGKVQAVQLTGGGLDNYDFVKQFEPAWKAIPYDDHRFLWPLPLTEITANPVLREQQNPGY